MFFMFPVQIGTMKCFYRPGDPLEMIQCHNDQCVSPTPTKGQRWNSEASPEMG